jgi:recombination protein RecA
MENYNVYNEIAELQAKGVICYLIDAAHVSTEKQLRGAGVDMEQIYISQPDTQEQVEELAAAFDRADVGAAIFILEVGRYVGVG